MKNFAITRNWDKNEHLPTSDGYIQLDRDEIVECSHPDKLDYEEFNLQLILNGKKVFARSIDFEFVMLKEKGEL